MVSKNDLIITGVCATIHGMINTVLMLIFTGLPFGHAGELSYIVYLITCACGSLVWISTLLSSITRSQYVAMFSIAVCFLSFAARSVALFVFGFVWGACSNNPLCDAGLNCTGDKPPGYVYAGPRNIFIAFYVLLAVNLAGDILVGWMMTGVVTYFSRIRSKSAGRGDKVLGEPLLETLGSVNAHLS